MRKLNYIFTNLECYIFVLILSLKKQRDIFTSSYIIIKYTKFVSFTRSLSRFKMFFVLSYFFILNLKKKERDGNLFFSFTRSCRILYNFLHALPSATIY